MKSLMIAAALILSAGVAHATASGEYGITGDYLATDAGKQCFQTAWDAAKPTPAQHAVAHEVHEAVMKVVTKQHPKIHAAALAFHNVMKAHPINLKDAVKAGRGIEKQTSPVHSAMFEGFITMVNSLSLEQRVAFNAAMKDCHQN